MTLPKAKITEKALSSFILMMMVLAFALKALIPAGFMPQSDGGFTKLVICSGMSEKTVLVLNEDTAPSEHHQEKTSKDLCAFQVLASGKILTPSPIITLQAPVYEPVVPEIANDRLLASIDQLSFEARGPPSA